MTLKKLLHNFNGHLHTVNSHRRLVRKYCFKLGLYRQGMMHDLSKYSPSEFIPGVKYYQDDTEALIMPSVKMKVFQRHGCIIRVGTNIILNTG